MNQQLLCLPRPLQPSRKLHYLSSESCSRLLVVVCCKPNHVFNAPCFIGFTVFSSIGLYIFAPVISLCQRLGLTRSVRNKPRARSAIIERRRRESPPEAKDERSESFAGGARGLAKQNRVFEHLPLRRPGVSIQRNHYQKLTKTPLLFIDHNVNP